MYLEFRNVTIQHQNKEPILLNINLFFKCPWIYSIIGAFGTGKTSLLNSIYDSKIIHFGEIFLNNKEIHSLTKKQYKKIFDQVLYIGIDNFFVINETVFEYLKREYLSQCSWKKQLFNYLTKYEIKQIHYYCSIFKIDVFFNQKINSLSLGQKKIVQITQIFCNKPKMILADELLANLDPKTADFVLSKIYKYVKKTNSIFINIEHNIDKLLSITDYIIAIKNKKIEWIKKKVDCNPKILCDVFS